MIYFVSLFECRTSNFIFLLIILIVDDSDLFADYTLINLKLEENFLIKLILFKIFEHDLWIYSFRSAFMKNFSIEGLINDV